MKTLISCIIALITATSADQAKLGYYPSHLDNGKLNASTIDEIVSDADRTIWYDAERNYQIKLGIPPKATFETIRKSLKDEEKKDFIVVYFHLALMDNKKEFIDAEAEVVTKNMREVGYQRVVVLGASAFGVSYIADTRLGTNNKQNKPEMATPRKPSD